ncbi:MAG: sulfatase-like hydrolase/transferase [Chloroflexota bacterium]
MGGLPLTIAMAIVTMATVVGSGPALGNTGRLPTHIPSDSRLDPDEHASPPPGWTDVRTPLVVEPAGTARKATTKRTNIVVLMLDDLAETDERILERMPAIKHLFMDQGIRFTDYHGNDPLCCPGRANFLSGLTASHHGVWTNDASLFDPRETIATELKARGYHTILAGKYLNRWTVHVRIPPGWSDYAFTDSAYYDYVEHTQKGKVFHDEDPEDYQPDVTFNRAMHFLRAAPPGRPIFAWLTPFSVHGGRDPRTGFYHQYPVVAPRARHDPRCDGLTPWVTPATFDDNADRPAFEQGWAPMPDGYDMEAACRALIPVDEGLRRVVRELHAQGRFRNTLFVLTSDNGMGWGAHGWIGKTVTFATPMPLFVTWIARRGNAPATDPTYLSNVDLAPTLCAVAGCEMGPYPNGLTHADGTSFLGLLDGSGGIVRQALYSEDRSTGLGWWSIRTTPDSPLGLWHYAEYATGERELYDSSGGPCWQWQAGDPGDPCELTNLADDPDHAALVADLHALLADAMASGGATRPFRGTQTGRRR